MQTKPYFQMLTAIIGCSLALAGALLLSSCGSKNLYAEAKEIPGGQWAYQDTLDFRFEVTDTVQMYHLYLDFEYADTFSTQNLYIKLYTLFPDGKRLHKQMSFDLFDAQGQPLGRCSGKRCRLHAVLQDKAYFNQPGAYSITLEQYTRTNPLPGIFSVGLAIEPTGEQR